MYAAAIKYKKKKSSSAAAHSVSQTKRNLKKSLPLPGSRWVGSVIQPAWGAFDGSDRATARNIMIAVVGNANNRVLGGVLEEMIHFGANAVQVQAALTQMPADFTSAVRGEALTNFLAGGTPLAFAQVAVQACPLDNGTLGPLLGLFQQFNAAGIAAPALGLAQVCSGLLQAGRLPADIVTAVQNAAPLLTTIPRANAVMDHTHAGGTYADAAIAAAFAPVDAAVLAEALTTLRTMAGTAGFAALSQEKKHALLGERAHLTTDLLRANAVAITQAADDGADATQKLADTRAFGYNQAFKDRAQQRGAAEKEAFTLHRTNEIRAYAEEQRRQAVLDKHAEAFETLSSKQRRALGGSPEKAINPTPPFITDKNFDQGVIHLKNKREELAAGAVANIDQQEQQDLQHLAAHDAPAREAGVIETHRAYFAGVNFHPDALTVLDIANEDHALATQIIQYFVAVPNTRGLFTGAMPLAKKRRLLTVPGAVLSALLTAGVTSDAVADFAENNNRVTLLTALQAGGIVHGRINGLAPLLGNLEVYVADGTCRGNLVTLLGTDNPVPVRQMILATPGTQLTRPALVVACRPHAADAATLVTILNLCSEFGWNQDEIQACVTALPVNRVLAVISQAVYAAHLIRYDKNANFTAWMNAVGQLVTKGYVTIQAMGGWVRLSGYPLTDEQFYRVRYVGGGNIDTFCVHYHPGASSASVANPYASVSHFKPIRGGDTRRGYNEAPASIKALTSKKP